MQPEIAQRIAATNMLKKKRRRRYSDDDLRPNVGRRVWPAWPVAFLERCGDKEVRPEVGDGVVDYLKSRGCDEARIETILDRYPFLMTSDDENHDGTASERILKLSNYCWNEHANGFELCRRKSRKDGVTLSCRTFIADEGFRIYTFPASFWMIPPRSHRRQLADWDNWLSQMRSFFIPERLVRQVSSAAAADLSAARLETPPLRHRVGS